MASLFRQANAKASGSKRKASSSSSAAAADDDDILGAEDPSSLSLSEDEPRRKNRQRVLLLPSRGVTSQMRHLISDLEALMPHSKKDAKLDTKSQLGVINELAELNNCNNTLYFEARKHQDLYMWASKTPNGPSAKLYVQNIHTMDELNLTGNCLKGSRPLLSFDSAFDDPANPHLGLLKEMFVQMFGVPKGARRSKPFVDHVVTFSVLDGKIWFRNWQIMDQDPGERALEEAQKLAASTNPNESEAATTDSAKTNRKSKSKSKSKPLDDSTPSSSATPPLLVEIGPRFTLSPIRFFEGSFSGATLYESVEYISPNTTRSLIKKSKADQYKDRSVRGMERRQREEQRNRERKVDELAVGNVFA